MNFFEIERKLHKTDHYYNIHEYVDYVKGVLDGTIVACEHIKLACQRVVDFNNRDDMYFDVEDVDKRINFIWKLRHTTGQHHGKHFRLLDWQQFVIANIFGWKWKENDLRVTRNVFIMISRKNGKTCLASAIALAAMICDREYDSEIDMIASNTKQATIAFDHTKNFCESVDPNQNIFKKYRSEIKVIPLKSKFQVLSSESMGLDGYSASVVVFDELHAQQNWDLYNVMKSSQGARQQPLMVTLTTAGFLIGDAYPCYSMWKNCIDILRREKQDDTQFAAIYQLDEDDDWCNENVWLKCSPSLDKTVFKTYLRDEINAAKNNTALEVGVRTKLLNQWCQSESIWLPQTLIEQYSKPFNIEDLIEIGARECQVGVDLSAVSDLTAISACSRIDDKYYFKNYAFLPEDTLHEGLNASFYKQCVRDGDLIKTQGNVTDYDRVLDVIKDIDSKLYVEKINYDTWNATQFAINASNDGLPMNPFSQAMGNFSRYTKEFERQLRMGNIIIDDSTLTKWCFANACLKIDTNGNCKPDKPKERTRKIDIVIAMIQAFAGYFSQESFINVEAI